MEVVVFSKTWQEIPEQDNPAMDYIKNLNGIQRPHECTMIFKGKYSRITNGGFVVAHVPRKGDIIKLGVFWRLEAAKMFANVFAS